MLLKLLYLFKFKFILIFAAQLKILELLNQFWRFPLELIQDRRELAVARVEVGILEMLSLVPTATKVAVDLELLAIVLQMLVDTFDGLDRLSTREALDLHALAFVFDMLFKVL